MSALKNFSYPGNTTYSKALLKMIVDLTTMLIGVEIEVSVAEINIL